MSNKILFTERQKFKKWWAWIILLSLNSILLFGVFKQIIGGQQFGNKPAGNAELLIISGVLLLLTLLFFNLRLDTIIKDDGIYVRFFPFHLKFKYFNCNRISKSYIRTYSPLTEYGGWGLRFGLFSKGRAYNVSGDKGLQLVFTDNTKLLIGTNSPEALAEILNKIGQLKE